MASATTPVKHNWNEEKTKLRQKFSELLDNEIKVGVNKKAANLEILEERLAEIKEELYSVISELN